MIPSNCDASLCANESSRSERVTRWKWLLMLGVLLMAVAVLGATLRSHPDISSKDVSFDYTTDPAFGRALAALDAANLQEINQAGIQAADPADTLTICRRLSLALVGNTMSLEEIRALEQIAPEKRVTWWVEHLLADHRWSDYFSQRIARACVGTHQGPFLLFRRRKFNAWLAEQLDKDVPYDAIVRQMIGSEGLWTDTPAVNFVTATMDEEQNGRADPVRLAGRTSRAFLAMRMDCLQCHDDVLQRTNFGTSDAPREGTQHDFHQLAAFYSGAAAEPVFRGITEDELAYTFQYLNQAEGETVIPAVPFYEHLLPTEGKPRKRLAAWVTHPNNKAFARASVNRTWALMFGRALVEPVDTGILHTCTDKFSIARASPVLGRCAGRSMGLNSYAYSTYDTLRTAIENIF